MTERKKNDNARPAALQRTAGTDHAPRRLRSAELFGVADQLIIEHAEREYRLRVTNIGKLILNAAPAERYRGVCRLSAQRRTVRRFIRSV